jgi:hypothetical protein
MPALSVGISFILLLQCDHLFLSFLLIPVLYVGTICWHNQQLCPPVPFFPADAAPFVGISFIFLLQL